MEVAETESNKNILLNPNWFFEHRLTPIISYLKNKVFQKECKSFKDESDNNLLHYFFMNCSYFDQNSLLLLKWCTQVGIGFNSKNKNNMTPFYYYVNFVFEKNFGSETGFEKYFIEIMKMHDRKTAHADGNSFLHIFCHSPYVHTHSNLIKTLIELNLEKLKERNNHKQIPLQIAMSFWRKPECLNLLYYLYCKTPDYCLGYFDSKGRNCFHLACEYDLVNLVENMLKKNPGLLHSRILNDEKTPIIFVVLKNASLKLVFYFLQKDQNLFLQKNENNQTIFDVLFQMYVLEKNSTYKKIMCKLAENSFILTNVENARNIIQKFKKYDLYGNYECLICQETKDIRDWEIPFACSCHEEKIHHSCMKKWYEISKSCPICDYKVSYECENLCDHIN